MQTEKTNSKYMRKYILIAAVTLALTACDNNGDNPDPSSGALQITASIGKSLPSRVSDDEWSAGDEIGISSTFMKEDGTSVPGSIINVKYTYTPTENGDGKFTGKNLYYYNSMTLTAYYPFTDEQGQAPGTDGIITASTGADNQSAENQPKIDFLWDSKTSVGQQKDFSATNPNVNFTFAHKMSKLTFTFKSSEPIWDDKDPTLMICNGVDVRDMNSYGIEGLGIDGTFDTATGDCAIDETKREGLTITCQMMDIMEEDKFKYVREFSSLIVFPQMKPTKNENSENENFILHIYTDELHLNDPEKFQHYKCTLTFSNGEIKPGYHYHFTITVTKTGLIVGEMTVERWEEEDRSMTATIDGENPFI